jgi:predicted Rossmann fold nucleotide-binding protein DprA/Smf involved in DNA uptake
VRLAIVGSQLKSWRGYTHEKKAKDWIWYATFFLEPTEIVSGGADGVDTWAEDAADLLAIQKSIFHPAQKTWEHFQARNLQIANYCEALVCIRSRLSKTYGSGWTADRAEALGRKVWRVTL